MSAQVSLVVYILPVNQRRGTEMAHHSVKLLIASALLVGCLNAALLVRSSEPSYKDFAQMARFLVHRLGV